VPLAASILIIILMSTLSGLIVEPQNLEACFSTVSWSKRLKQRQRLFEPLLMAPVASEQLALSGYPVYFIMGFVKKQYSSLLQPIVDVIIIY
jgi:hypothetical protein